MKCPNCSAEIPNNASKCAYCNIIIHTPKKPTGIYILAILALLGFIFVILPTLCKSSGSANVKPSPTTETDNSFLAESMCDYFLKEYLKETSPGLKSVICVTMPHESTLLIKKPETWLVKGKCEARNQSDFKTIVTYSCKTRYTPENDMWYLEDLVRTFSTK